VNGLHGIGLVAGRELSEALRRKSLWVVAAVLLLGSAAAMVVPELLDDEGRDRYTVTVVGGSPELDEALAAVGSAVEADIAVTTSPDRAAARLAVEEGDADVAAVAGDAPAVVAEAGANDRLVAAVQQALALDGLVGRLEASGLTAEEAQAALSAPAPAVERLDEESSERRAASAVLGIVLYLLLLSLMVQVANGTAIEKANRISEVLLAIVRPGALLFGKVLGVGVVGLLVLACGVIPVVVKLAVGGDLPPGLGGALAASAAWFLFGIALYLTIGGALGALVERQEEAGSAVMPLTITLIGAYIIGQTSPEGTLATVLAYVPLTSPLIVPPRLAMGAASPVEVVVSLVLGVLAVVVAVRFGAVVYRRAIVRTGRRLKLRDVLQGA
jgi:ABC-2 type transport system permease protein